MGYRIRIGLLRFCWGLLFLTVLLAPLLLSIQAGGRGDLMLELSLVAGLLAGSVLLFAVLSLAMWFTRNLHRPRLV